MACYESGTVISLGRREVISLPDVYGATLRVTRGTLWLTEERDGRDVVLGPGDNWTFESGGKTVVEARNEAVFCIVGKQAAALKLTAHAHAHSGLLSALAGLFGSPPRQVPYF